MDKFTLRKALYTALRTRVFPDSTKFKQGFNALRTQPKDIHSDNMGNEFCCLGVACEVHRQLTGTGSWVGSKGLIRMFYRFETDNSYGERNHLPDSISTAYGFAGNNPLLGGEYATNINDEGTKFSKIAGQFEAVYPENGDG